MQTYLDCYPCFLRQALDAARMVGANETQQRIVMRKVMDELKDIRAGITPPEIGYTVHQIVRISVAEGDPYREIKERSTREALALYPHLKALVADSADPLETAVRLSIAGNIIDFGPHNHIPNLLETVERVLAAPLMIDDLALLRSMLDAASEVLFLADNAGETVFDRVLIEALPIPVTYTVKSFPILNDATEDDAVDAGVDTCATIITNGTSAPGTILSLCSDSFRRIYNAAPLIIAKGQANYETLSTAGSRVFSLLQVKCHVIGRDIGVPVGSFVVRQNTTGRSTP